MPDLSASDWEQRHGRDFEDRGDDGDGHLGQMVPHPFFDSAELPVDDQDLDLEQFNSENHRLLLQSQQQQQYQQHGKKKDEEASHQLLSSDSVDSSHQDDQSDSSQTSPPPHSSSTRTLSPALHPDHPSSSSSSSEKKFRDEESTKLKTGVSSSSSSSSLPSSSSSGSIGEDAGRSGVFDFKSCQEIECEAGGTCVVDLPVTPTDELQVSRKQEQQRMQQPLQLTTPAAVVDDTDDQEEEEEEAEDRILDQRMHRLQSLGSRPGLLADTVAAADSLLPQIDGQSGSLFIPVTEPTSPKVRCRCPLGRKGFFCEKRKNTSHHPFPPICCTRRHTFAMRLFFLVVASRVCFLLRICFRHRSESLSFLRLPSLPSDLQLRDPEASEKK